MWEPLRVSHIPIPPATTTDKDQKRQYTNIPLGTKDRSGHDAGKDLETGMNTIDDCTYLFTSVIADRKIT